MELKRVVAPLRAIPHDLGLGGGKMREIDFRRGEHLSRAHGLLKVRLHAEAAPDLRARTD